jgi:predicted amidohydrolase
MITTIQSALHWEDKQANLAMFEKKIMAIDEKTEIVILPEMFSTGFSMKPESLAEKMDGETVAWMKRIAAQKRIILTGSLIIEDGGEYFNRLVWMLPNGQYGLYDKRHLFAYADEHQHYTPGGKRLIASVKGWRILLIVCYDLRFPIWCRQSRPGNRFLPHENPEDSVQTSPARVEPEYDLLICVANWPERRNHAWKTLLQARAIENLCYVAGVNRVGNDGNNIYHSGDSMIVGPMGEVLYTRQNDEDVHTLTLQKETLEEVRKKLPFLEDAEDFIIQS